MEEHKVAAVAGKKPEERDLFERWLALEAEHSAALWFVMSFGRGRPTESASAVREPIAALSQLATQIEVWEARHRAALAAWAERHSRVPNGAPR